MGKKFKSKKWDLSVVAKDLTLPELLEAWRIECRKEAKLREKSIKSLADFKKWYFIYRKAAALYTRVNVIYSELSKIENKNDETKDFIYEKRRIDNEIDDLNDKIIDVKWLFRDNSAKINAFFKDAEIKKYKYQELSRWFVSNKHALTKEQEKELKKERRFYKDIDNIYDSVLNRIRINEIYDENGVEVSPHSKLSQLYKCDNQAIRKNTFIAHVKPKYDTRFVFSSIAVALATHREHEARLAKYDSWFSKFMDENYEFERKEYTFCINQSFKFSKLFDKWRKYDSFLIKETYGLDKLNVWDEKIQIKDTNDTVTIPEAKDDVRKALSCLGDEYLEYVDWFLNSKRINWDNKCNSAGYSLSNCTIKEEGVINFDWDCSSVATSTLCHELGHSIYSAMKFKNNEVAIRDKEIIQEFPSIVNSVISALYFIDKMKKNGAKKEHIYGIYNDILPYLFMNINHNASNHIFVDCAVARIMDDEPFTNDDFENLFLKWKADSCGYSKTYENNIKNNFPQRYDLVESYYILNSFLLEPEQWDHSLSYYFGSILGLYVGYRIYYGDKDLLAKYLKFLKIGNVSNPIKVLKEVLGINLLKPEIYTSAKQVLSKLINQFEKDIKI